MLAGRGVGTSRGLQCLMFVVDWAVLLVAEEVVLEGVYVGDMGARARFELHELMGGKGCWVE